ncbi:MAG: hypothetical protein IJ569_04325 [Prevotella sp.]|nr:hypothetical protein [Prevotella sp.]
MKKTMVLITVALLLLSATSCRRYLYRKPVYRPVEYVEDSLIHNDIPKAEEENQKMLDEVENEAVMTVPDIPQETDLLKEENRHVDVEKMMREGI